MKKLYFVLCVVSSFELSMAQDSSRTRVSGLAYLDYFYNVGRDSLISSFADVATGGSKDLNGFQIRRVFFTVDHDLSADFTMRFRLEGDGVSMTSNGKMGVTLKDTYLRWKNIFPANELTIGLQPTPAYELSEAVWGYRFLEKTIMDLRGIVSPRDLAISLRSKFEKPGSFNYWLMLGNNSNNSDETDKYKRLYANLQWIVSSAFQLTGYGDYAMRSSIANPNVAGTTMDNDIFTTGIFAGYSVPNDYAVGAEGFFQTTQNGLKKGSTAPFILAPKYGMGFSLFAYAYVENNVSFVLRYDFYDPNIDTDIKGDMRHYVVFGLSWKPEKNVAITPNVLVETYEQSTTQSFVSSMTGRVTFFVSY